MAIVDMLGFIAVATCFVVSGWMVVWCEYEDGIVGKIGLGMLSLGCLTILIELTEGVYSRFTPIRVLIMGGVAIFLVRHLWRTYKFSRKNQGAAK